jgi:hypothetical protein
MNTKSLIYLILITFFINIESVSAASYSTLPKNVNTLVFKQVMVSKIETKYNSSNEEASLNLKEEFTSSRLEDISTVIKSYFQELQEISPEAYSNFSLGEFSADIEANVSAQGLGYGHGITDRLTVYGSLPIYHIKTVIKFVQTKANNLAAIQATLAPINPDTAIGKFVKDLTLQLPNTNAELLQSLVVNFYGYKPIGKWERDALGDAEVGLIYRLTDFTDRGISVTAGAVLPTGLSDDADSLQDVSTGDGQYDAFSEIASGFSVLDNTFQFDLKTRYTYQFASEKEVRWLDNLDVPLAKDKKTVSQKLGNKVDATATITYNPTYWLNFNSSLIYSNTTKTKYENVENSKVKEALEYNTDTESRWLKVGVGISTIEAYQRKKFDLPMDVGVSAQRLLNAKNSINYDRFDIDFKLYF